MTHHKPIACSRILITGLVRNVAKLLESEILKIHNAFANFKEISFFIVESDSTDDTLRQLEKLSASNLNFNYVSLGKLENKIPERIERLAYCREVCASFTRERISAYDYVCVADLDGTNDLLNVNAVTSCWDNNEWDVCTANQEGSYYDVYALRHETWCPRDYNLDIFLLESQGYHPMRARRQAVLKRQRKIRKGSDWIQVESAFGGLAIYTSSAFAVGRYSHIDPIDGNIVCEHVTFHKLIRQVGGRIYINPNLINHKAKIYGSSLGELRYVVRYIMSWISPKGFKKWEISRAIKN